MRDREGHQQLSQAPGTKRPFFRCVQTANAFSRLTTALALGASLIKPGGIKKARIPPARPGALQVAPVMRHLALLTS
jgi:hypothetical protein